jgi:centromeric protein E
VYVGDLTEKPVYSAHEVMELLQKGEGMRYVDNDVLLYYCSYVLSIANRSIGETNMNERSSRSHTIFRMVSGYTILGKYIV